MTHVDGMPVRNGKVQLQITNKDKRKTPSEALTAEKREKGRIRKAIEDRRLERDLMGGDLW